VKLLLSKGADSNGKNSMGETALHTAARKGSMDIFELLVSRGGDPFLRSQGNGTPPVEIAIQAGERIAVEEILRKAGKPVPDMPVTLDELRRIIDARYSKKKDGAHDWDDPACIMPFLQSNPSLVTAADGCTLLYHAVERNAVRIAAALIELGAAVNARCAAQQTPLHRAWGPDMAALLIEHGADINAADTYGTTPLHKASDMYFEFLLEKGADPARRDKWGRTPVDLLMQRRGPGGGSLHEAVKHNAFQTARLLIEAGADTKALDQYGRSCLMKTNDMPMLELLINKGAPVNAQDKKGRTVLHDADNARTAFFIAHGADVNIHDVEGWTPLFYVGADLEKARALIAAGADVNAENRHGFTVLYYLGAQSLDVCRLLIESGADVNRKNRHGKTALQEARRNSYTGLVRFLEQHGAREEEKF
jgi:ankyrin repeat protein